MTKNPIGRILDKSNNREFYFVSTAYFKGEFVQVPIKYPENKEGIIVGEIISKEAVNPYFERPSTINYLKDNDESITSWNLYIIKVKPIAVLKEEGYQKLDFPPPPGSNVYTADENIVRQALGLTNGEIPIGYLKQMENLEVCISENLLCKTHYSILGRTGSGKSYLTKGLLKHIKNRTLIVFSPTEEYNKVAREIGAQIISAKEITLPLETYELSNIYGFTLQEQILFEQFMKKDKSIFDRIQKISNNELASIFHDSFKPKTRERLQSKLFELDNESKFKIDGLEEKIPRYADTIISKIKSKPLFFAKQSMEVPFQKSTVIDMSEIDQESQEVIVMYVLSKLLECYRDEIKRKKYPKLIIIIEEAHNFAPSIQGAFSKGKIIQMAREGRKLGITLSLISQRPRFLDQTVLSQCGTLFLFHIPHPDDIEHVFGSSSIYRQDLVDTVRELMVGECLILGDIVKYPLLCNISWR